MIPNILKARPSKYLLDQISSIPQREQYITTITISEIVYGAMKSVRPEHHMRNLEEVLLPSVNIVGFDSKAAYVCGRLRAELEKVGKPLDLADLEMAAIAMAGEFTLVTGNSKHFGRIDGLKIENWIN